MAFRRYLDIKILDVKIRAAVLIPASPIPRPWLPSLVGTHLLTLGRTNGPGRQYRMAVLNRGGQPVPGRAADQPVERPRTRGGGSRSEEHTSELQSRGHLVCRLLLEKKKKKRQKQTKEHQKR